MCCVAALLSVMSLAMGTTMTLSQETLQGQYIVYASNQASEQDDYQIVPGKKYVDDVRMIPDDNQRSEYELVYRDDAFQYFLEERNGLTKSRVTLENDILTFYDQLAMIGALPVEGNVIVFDPGVYTHYAYLVHTYNQQDGGKQIKDVVVPAMQDFVSVEVERHGSDAVKLPDKAIDAAHYRIVFGKKKELVSVWFDGDRMIGMYFASKNKIVVDNGYNQLYDRLKQIINRAI
jgi:hypothetical protein